MTTPLFLPVTTSNQSDFNRRVALAVNPLLGPLAAGAVSSFNTRTGAVTLLSADVTAALGYVPTSVTGLTGIQSVAAFKTGLSLVKADVGLGSVDNTFDASKSVLSATKLTTARTLAATGDVTWSGSFDGSANFSVTATIGANAVTFTKLVAATQKALVGANAAGNFQEITLGSGLSLTAGVLSASGSGGTVTSVSVITANGVSGTVATPSTTPAITLTLGAITPSSVAATGTVTGSNLSGTNTGDQTITLTGDVTGSGTGSFATTIAIGAWAVTTPTPTPNTGAFTTASSNIRAIKIGKAVFFKVSVTLTNVGTAPAEGAAGYCDVAMPYASVNSGFDQSYGGREVGVTGRSCGGTLLKNSTTFRMQRYDGTAMHTNGYILSFDGVYEAA